MAINSKKTIEDYITLADKAGIKFIGPFPKNTAAKTEWECNRGHRWHTPFYNIRSGCACPTCGVLNKMTIKESDYHNKAEQNGFKFVGQFPMAGYCYTEWECWQGHRWEAPYNRLRGCPICLMVSESDYISRANEKGYEFLGPMPETSFHLTNWRCHCGSEFQSTYQDIRNYAGCRWCIPNGRKIITDYHILSQKHSLVFIGPFPKNASTKTMWQCPIGHTFDSSYVNIRGGHGCWKCDGRRGFGKDFHKIAREHGLEWIGKILPERAKDKTEWQCSKNHTWFTTYGEIKRGRGCPVCAYEKHSGPGNHNWRGGPRVKGDEYEWENICRQARRRDEYKCQICGRKRRRDERQLDVHHIVPKRYLPRKFWHELTNLITLCQAHHMIAEHTLKTSISELRNILIQKYRYDYSGDNLLENFCTGIPN